MHMIAKYKIQVNDIINDTRSYAHRHGGGVVLLLKMMHMFYHWKVILIVSNQNLKN